ncbi:MAG: hypothetical protein JWR09_2953 [Mucilaginibacter sp.]|nr:hypothetical protein [Mucilaginibacter sp.]
MKIFAVSFIIVWLIVGLFFGIGGLTKLNSDETLDNIQKKEVELLAKNFNPPLNVDGVTISNEYLYQIYNERHGLEKYFVWTVTLPKFTALCITAMSFGLLGALVAIIRQLSLAGKTIVEVQYISLPLLGILTGLVVLGISYLLPTLITKGTNEIRPITLMFLCLFCGICSDNFYKKIENSFDKLFTGK